MFDRIIQLLMLAVATTSLILTLLPPPAPTSVPRLLFSLEPPFRSCSELSRSFAVCLRPAVIGGQNPEPRILVRCYRSRFIA